MVDFNEFTLDVFKSCSRLCVPAVDLSFTEVVSSSLQSCDSLIQSKAVPSDFSAFK